MTTREPTEIVLLDLDNTLYDWVAFFVPALRAMLAAMAEFLNMDDDVLVLQLREAFRRHDSVEYAFVAQTLPAAKGLSGAERRQLVELAQEAFSRARETHLCLYPGVQETLDEVRKRGILLVATTNAPLFQAERRLRHLGILDHFRGMAARTSFPVPENDPAISAISERARTGHYKSAIPWRWSLQPQELKPSNRMYRTILAALKIPAARALIVGDSVAKDVVPAVKLGARGAWARYGTTQQPDHVEFLLRVTPWSAEAIREEYALSGSERLLTLDRFEDLLRFV
jgi:FMN phosphatase YigB (HAD superfamily)